MPVSGEIWKPAARLPAWAGPVRAGVIAIARARQRRRRLALAAMAAAVSAAAFGAALARPLSAPPASHRAVGAAPAALLAKAPYMGVACHVANLISCDRVGLAVWLRHPALRVTATLAGRRFALDDALWSGPRRAGRRKLFAGFLQPAGIVTRLHVRTPGGRFWSGSPAPPPAQVRLRVDYGGGRVLTTRVAVDLSTGWG